MADYPNVVINGQRYVPDKTMYRATPDCPECGAEISGYGHEDDVTEEVIGIGRRFGPVTFTPCHHRGWVVVFESTEHIKIDRSVWPLYMRLNEEAS